MKIHTQIALIKDSSTYGKIYERPFCFLQVCQVRKTDTQEKPHKVQFLCFDVLSLF